MYTTNCKCCSEYCTNLIKDIIEIRLIKTWFSEKETKFVIVAMLTFLNLLGLKSRRKSQALNRSIDFWELSSCNDCWESASQIKTVGAVLCLFCCSMSLVNFSKAVYYQYRKIASLCLYLILMRTGTAQMIVLWPTIPAASAKFPVHWFWTGRALQHCNGL